MPGISPQVFVFYFLCSLHCSKQWMTMHALPATPVIGSRQIWLHGVPWHLPLLTQFQVVEITRAGLSPISHAKVLGDPKSDMAYLLLAPNQAVQEERRFGLVAVWTHPCQAHLPSVDLAVRKLALLIYWKGLGLHLHTIKWGLPTHPLIHCQAHQHHDWWCTQQECLWAS